MRHIMIDFNTSPIEAGYLGEHNATEIVVVKPVDLSGDMYSVAFMTNGEVIHSKYFSDDEEIRVALWQQLTQDNDLFVQLEAYDGNGNYLGKSSTVKLLLSNSVHGTDIIADTDNPDVYSEIALNSWFRETLEDNADTLDKLSTSEDGKLLFDGNPIESGKQVLASEVFYDNPELQDSTNSVKGALDEAIEYVLHGIPEIYLEKSKLDNAIDKALKEAKESGEFDGEDYVLTDADKAEIADMTKPKLTMVEMKSDYDTGFVHDYVAKTITIECALLPVNARVRRIEIPDVVNETDEYFNLENMMEKDTEYKQNAPYIITYPKNMQGEFFTVAACVYFPSESNRFFDAVSGQRYFDKTIKIYYEIEE